jgi:hypothetical protein
MFFANQPETQKSEYVELLQAVGSLSKLFNDNPIPYLGYRISENLFCKAFDAENLSRSDCSADARKTLSRINTGIGIKTFIEGNGTSLQKIAEFNKARQDELKDLSVRDFVQKIAVLRNERLRSTKEIHGLDTLIYHCILRKEGIFKIHEQFMDNVQSELINSIRKRSSGNTILFNDTVNEYSFNLSKSTLYKRFISNSNDYEIDISILNDPFEVIKNIFSQQEGRLITPAYQSIVLPLYSPRNPHNPQVPEKSGLNQWNARGRARHEDELYIPIPNWIHGVFPDFFPKRNEPFTLKLPNHNILTAKVCQDNSKALMSSPNKDLGHWLLRDVLNVPPDKVVTYDDLERINVDTVEITKQDTRTFIINFKELGTYSDFERQYRS